MLVSCHDDNPIGKFFGVCNDVKIQLDKCFKAEKEEKRQKNMQRGREVEERFQRKLAEIQKRKEDEKAL
jgi:COX assembly protein 2